MAEHETGTVQWFNNSTGFGLIHRDSGGDVFVHYTYIQGDGFRKLRANQKVEFVVNEEDEKGPQAENVTQINESVSE